MKAPYTAEKINRGRMAEEPDRTSGAPEPVKMVPENKTDNSVNTMGKYLTPKQQAKKHKKNKKYYHRSS